MRYKEVININDGCRLGYVGDVEIRLPEGQVTAIIVPGPFRISSLFRSEKEDIVIPWKNIRCFGDDVILVDIDCGVYAK